MPGLNESILTGTARPRGISVSLTVAASSATYEVYRPPQGYSAFIKSISVCNNINNRDLYGNFNLGWENGTATQWIKYEWIDIGPYASKIIVDSNNPIALNHYGTEQGGSNWAQAVGYDGLSSIETYPVFYLSVIEWQI